jgi:predicted regulator of Ras-like GTPase activity (Roadblock/LC7/MglB family)
MVDHAEFEKIVAAIRARVDGVSAVALLGPGSGVEALVRSDPGFDEETLAEFATLLRIAERVSADTASGPLGAMSWKTEHAVVLMHRVSSERSVLLVGSPGLPASLARYQLSRAARRLAGALPASV